MSNLFTPVLQKERKECGHYCYPSTTPKCCSCMDARPILAGNTFPSYTDGLGWTNDGTRDDGYCPVCNTKNFDRWQKEMTEKLAVKATQDAELQAAKEGALKTAEADKSRAEQLIQGGSGVFTYSNGDVYEGEMLNGERFGNGKITYFEDGSMYDGQFVHDEPEGFGKKFWADGIEYVGEWKAGKMHGYGRYVMCDGYVMEGLFQNDEFMGG